MRVRFIIAWVIGALFAGYTLRVRAQAGAVVTSPQAPGSVEVSYPPGARGEGVVVLELVIDREGKVAAATVVDGTDRFGEWARAAALSWTFVPAKRGDLTVSARVRAQVVFHQPETNSVVDPKRGAESNAEVPPPLLQVSPSGADIPSQAEPSEDLMVNVAGVRQESGQTTLSYEDIRQMPGAFGDPFRAIEALPGVTPIVSGLPYFYIRGAPPNDNGYFIDGIRVPLLFHAGVGQGVIHPALLDRVDFYPGIAPARYGRVAGAMLAGQTREPAAVTHGEANLRLFDVGSLLETPFAEGRGSVLAAGRYAYPGPVLSAITSDVKLGYWDYQTRGTWQVNRDDTVGVFAFGSHDYLATGTPLVEQFEADFHRVDVRFDHTRSNGYLRLGATLGYDSIGSSAGDNQTLARTTDRSVAVRLEFERALAETVRLRGGTDSGFDSYTFAQGQVATLRGGETQPAIPSSANPPPTNITWGAHADVVWRAAPRVEIVPRARIDVFESSRDGGFTGALSGRKCSCGVRFRNA